MPQPITLAALTFSLLAAMGARAIMAQSAPPSPRGVLPSPRHLRWHELEFYGFLHFTTNTFTDREWGYGDEDPAIFNPTNFDAEQIVSVAEQAGMRGLILTCKHHDGFCLWPSDYTEHDIASSPWKGGKGDVVREISDACARHGLKFGVYLSPWDRNRADYGQPSYVEYYRDQLRELLTRYGPIFEVWWDGANGGDGYYGGARETRHIDRSTYYGWEETTRIVRELQPDAVIFSDAGDLRWVGNEQGLAGDPCWATYSPRPADGETRAVPGTTRYWEGTSGHRDGEMWMPAECDVSIRPGWFYHAGEDGRVKGPEQLVDLYYASVGRGASLLLNVPPDRSGRIHETDAASLRGFRAILDATFGSDLASGATASATNTRGGDRAYAPANICDGHASTYWATDDAVHDAEIVLELPNETGFNVVSLREYLPLGQRVNNWALDAWQDGGWTEFAKGSAIGARRLWRGTLIQTDRVRLRLSDAEVCPALSEFALFAEPPRITIVAPADAFLDAMRVELRSSRPDARIRYTLDGSQPTGTSRLYVTPIILSESATLRARGELDGVLSPLEASRSFQAYSHASLLQAVALFRAPGAGLRAEFFEGGWQTLEQLQDATPVRSLTTPDFSLEPRSRDEHFAAVFSGFINVPTDGLYTFLTSSDDGSRLYLHDRLVVDNDGLHGMVERSGVVGLRAGFHPFRVEYFNASGQFGLQVRWTTPGGSPGAIPGSVLFGGE
ncbi:MAG: alpha-L-fucosidase [Phycisphaerales bacterium]|nr:alpha-L-fucosidase [Phycisphaerales bacterium]